MSRCCGGFTAGVVPGAGAYLLCRLPTLPLACFIAPYPPTRARRALFPSGEGGVQSLFRRGLRPRHPCIRLLAALTDPARTGARRRAYLLCCPPTLPLVYFAAPYPPSPLPLRGRGRLKVYFAGGFAPGTPALDCLRHLQLLPYRHPAKGSLRLGAKTVEMLSFGQCRQPRRGGTGGEELRRLRWSSPPGQE